MINYAIIISLALICVCVCVCDLSLLLQSMFGEQLKSVPKKKKKKMIVSKECHYIKTCLQF